MRADGVPLNEVAYRWLNRTCHCSQKREQADALLDDFVHDCGFENIQHAIAQTPAPRGKGHREVVLSESARRAIRKPGEPMGSVLRNGAMLNETVASNATNAHRSAPKFVSSSSDDFASRPSSTFASNYNGKRTLDSYSTISHNSKNHKHKYDYSRKNAMQANHAVGGGTVGLVNNTAFSSSSSFSGVNPSSSSSSSSTSLSIAASQGQLQHQPFSSFVPKLD